MAIVHKGTQYLEGEKIYLKKDDMESFSKIWDYLLSDKEAIKKCKWKEFESKEYFLEGVSKYKLKDNEYIWTIWEKETNTPVGGISVHSQVDEKGECKIGYSIHPKHWGLGYATEALKLVLDYMLNEVGYDKIITDCLVENIASRRVMEKAGMTFDSKQVIQNTDRYVFYKTK